MKRKRFISMMLLGIMVFSVAGCAGKGESPEKELKKLSLHEIRKQAENLKVPYKNLDLSKAKITIPEVDEVYGLTFPVSKDSFERQTEKFEENIRKYEGLSKDVDLKKYMKVMYWDKQKNDRPEIPFKEATEQQKKNIQYLGYNDGKCSQCLIWSTFMLELGDYSVPTKLTGDKKDYSKNSYGYIGYQDLGTVVKKYDLSKDDISGVSYRLSDGKMALSDAVSYVEKHMKEDYYFVGSKYLDYHVFGVTVYRLTDDIYHYAFDVGTSYQGVSLNKDDSSQVNRETEKEQKDSGKFQIYGTNHLAMMFQKNRLGYVYSCFQNFESVKVKHTYQSLLSLEDVCGLLSNYVSKNKKFKISTVELIYQTEVESQDGKRGEEGCAESVHARPVYHFSVLNTELSEYATLYFDVDAVSGKIVTMAGM